MPIRTLLFCALLSLLLPAQAAASIDPALLGTWQEAGTGIVLDINPDGKFVFFYVFEYQQAIKSGKNKGKLRKVKQCYLGRSGELQAPNRLPSENKDAKDVSALAVEHKVLYQTFKPVDAAGTEWASWYEPIAFPSTCKRNAY